MQLDAYLSEHQLPPVHVAEAQALAGGSEKSRLGELSGQAASMLRIIFDEGSASLVTPQAPAPAKAPSGYQAATDEGTEAAKDADAGKKRRWARNKAA
ncbi:unnamed protein product [Effrenium voratum]|uniref:Uncharacterized protein n=1 Tax=Effrenium voratum TaxID=2562239 RepID=A0AA36HSM6_9DINO|nr:unnamed protein product [Effrenium voratum]CAJ1432131.1 unnamed protein product [Effrenium voratum]